MTITRYGLFAFYQQAVFDCEASSTLSLLPGILLTKIVRLFIGNQDKVMFQQFHGGRHCILLRETFHVTYGSQCCDQGLLDTKHGV